MAEVHAIEFREPAARATDAPASGELRDLEGEKMVLNMGPSHPSTHGVLRILLEMDGEIITKAMPDIGYLHRGDEKIAENMTYTQFIPYTDRLDYLAPLASNVAYALALSGNDCCQGERHHYEASAGTQGSVPGVLGAGLIAFALVVGAAWKSAWNKPERAVVDVAAAAATSGNTPNLLIQEREAAIMGRRETASDMPVDEMS